MKYEMMTIYKITLGDQGSKDLSSKVQELVTSFGGKVLEQNFWGKRKLSYEIKHDTEGYYDVIVFELEPSAVTKLKGKLNLLSGLVRYLVTAKI
jgi:small subunit ribosomal protein S6